MGDTFHQRREKVAVTCVSATSGRPVGSAVCPVRDSENGLVGPLFANVGLIVSLDPLPYRGTGDDLTAAAESYTTTHGRNRSSDYPCVSSRRGPHRTA